MGTSVVKVDTKKEITTMLNDGIVRQKFIEVLDKGASGFISNLLSMVSSDENLSKAVPMTVMGAAMQAATLKLPINKNLGLAYIIPYFNGKTKTWEAQFQMGWRGFIQLAERTGQYKTINASVVYEGMVESVDFITGEIIKGKRTGDTVIGYVAYIEMLNGFHKTLYMTKAEMEAHAKKYSQTYKKGFGVWKDNFDAMGLKTVLKQLISKYGIMSIDMQSEALSRSMAADQAVVKDLDGTLDYVDNKKDMLVVDPLTLDSESETVLGANNVNDAVAPVLDANIPEMKTKATSPKRATKKAEAPTADFMQSTPFPGDDDAPGF